VCSSDLYQTQVCTVRPRPKHMRHWKYQRHKRVLSDLDLKKCVTVTTKHSSVYGLTSTYTYASPEVPKTQVCTVRPRPKHMRHRKYQRHKCVRSDLDLNICVTGSTKDTSVYGQTSTRLTLYPGTSVGANHLTD
jgi:hypothetical protein